MSPQSEKNSGDVLVLWGACSAQRGINSSLFLIPVHSTRPWPPASSLEGGRLRSQHFFQSSKRSQSFGVNNPCAPFDDSMKWEMPDIGEVLQRAYEDPLIQVTHLLVSSHCTRFLTTMTHHFSLFCCSTAKICRLTMLCQVIWWALGVLLDLLEEKSGKERHVDPSPHRRLLSLWLPLVSLHKMHLFFCPHLDCLCTWFLYSFYAYVGDQFLSPLRFPILFHYQFYAHDPQLCVWSSHWPKLQTCFQNLLIDISCMTPPFTVESCPNSTWQLNEYTATISPVSQLEVWVSLTQWFHSLSFSLHVLAVRKEASFIPWISLRVDSFHSSNLHPQDYWKLPTLLSYAPTFYHIAILP